MLKWVNNEWIVTFYNLNLLFLWINWCWQQWFHWLSNKTNHNISYNVISYLLKEMLKIFKSKLLIIEYKDIEFNSGFNNCTFRYNIFS